MNSNLAKQTWDVIWTCRNLKTTQTSISHNALELVAAVADHLETHQICLLSSLDQDQTKHFLGLMLAQDKSNANEFYMAQASISHNALELVAAVADDLAVVLRKTCLLTKIGEIYRLLMTF